ncbi:MAG: GNAT family protein [Ignavibacteriales bacterium]|nr:GNAT family protein [Ignavibacteriales bacterium]
MFTELISARLKLRKLCNSDSKILFEYRSNPDVFRYQSWQPKTEKEIDLFITKQLVIKPAIPGTWFQLAITLKDSGLLIGDCGLHFLSNDDQQVEVGITLSPAYQGKGYASESLTTVLDYLFFQLNKHRVYGSVDPRNYPSIKLLEKIGMRKEAHFKKSLWFKSEWVDDVIYAILEDEWKLITHLTQPDAYSYIF